MPNVMNPKELLLQTAHGKPPHPFELFTRAAGPGEFHFYAQGVTLADFGSLFENEIKPLDILISRLPPGLLNPNYWEPLTREAEETVRAKQGGMITQSDGDRRFIWRTDRVAKSRLLKEDLDAPLELLNGALFRTTGAGLLQLGRAWKGDDRFEWAGLKTPSPGEVSLETLVAMTHDLALLHPSLPAETFLYVSQEDHATRVVFARPDLFYRAIEALLRGFLHGATGTSFGHINRAACDRIARLADGVGLSAAPDRHVVDKARTVEVHLRLGRTPWAPALKPDREPLVGDEQALIYYDRTAGIWAVA